MPKKSSTTKEKPIYVTLLKSDDTHYLRISPDGGIIASKKLADAMKPFNDLYNQKMQYYEGSMSMAIFDLQLQPKICQTTETDIMKSVKLPAQSMKYGSIVGIPCNCQKLYESKKCVSVSKEALFK